MEDLYISIGRAIVWFGIGAVIFLVVCCTTIAVWAILGRVAATQAASRLERFWFITCSSLGGHSKQGTILAHQHALESAKAAFNAQSSPEVEDILLSGVATDSEEARLLSAFRAYAKVIATESDTPTPTSGLMLLTKPIEDAIEDDTDRIP